MPLSSEQRLAIMELLASGLESREVAARAGVTPQQAAAVKAHMTMGTYGEAEPTREIQEQVVEAVDAAFGLERDLQSALRQNIGQLEAGLTIIDDDREQTVASGRIDITARDESGAVVVIELKAGSADRDAIGQILAYMGDLMTSQQQVRGLLIARDFTARAKSAARAVPNLRLVGYGFRFTFNAVSGGA